MAFDLEALVDKVLAEYNLPHVHQWRHLGGGHFGQYRCDGENGCMAFGYSKVYRGMNRNQQIVPYSCAKCGGWAVGHDVVTKRNWKMPYDRQEWRCKHHRVQLENQT